MSWVRLWHDMPTDPKWRVIARKSGQPIPCVLSVFSMMLINAGQNNGERGVLLNFDSEDVAAALDMLTEDVDAILDAMQGKVLEGRKLSGWEKRQPKREDNTAADRKAAWKERQKLKRNATERIGTHGNAPDTDADADSDSEDLEPKGSCATQVAPKLKPEHFVESWNSKAARYGLPTVRDLTPERRVKLNARIAGYSLDDFRAVLAAIDRSPFLQGERGWKGCTFDWITKKANFQKVLEGNYDG